MQKRLLALVATVAMVLSMFAGVAFAADPTHKFLLSTPKVISSDKHPDWQLVQATIVKADNSHDDIDFEVEVKYTVDDGYFSVEKQVVVAPKGVLSFLMPTHLKPQDVKLTAYEKRANDADPFPFGEALATADIEVRYNVTTEPSDLTFKFTGAQSPTIIKGKVTDRYGNPVEGAAVALDSAAAKGPATLTQDTTDKGEFSLVLLEWAKADTFNLTVDSKVHREVKVTAKSATLEVSPKSIAHSLLSSYEFTLEGEGFVKDQTVKFTHKLKNSNGNDVTIGDATVGDDGTFTTTFNWDPPKAAGTYTITAKTDTHEAKVTITVTNPARYNWMNQDLLEELEVGDNPIKIGKADGIYLLTYDGTTVNTDDYKYVVIVDDEVELDQREEDEDTITIAPTKLGEVKVEVVAYELGEAGEYQKVTSKTFVAKVNGLDVEVDTTTLTVNQKQTITFVVKNADGVPVNNATVKFNNNIEIDPSETNIQNGTYVVKDYEPKTVEPITVDIEVANGPKATLTLTVVGQQVYTVSGEEVTLLQGKEQTLRLTVLDKDGKPIIPQGFEMQYPKKTPVALTPVPVMVDGSYSAIDVKVTATQSGKLVLRAKNYNGTECGEFTVDVVAPELVLIDEEAVNLTDYVKTTVKFKVVDPRDGSVITENIELVGSYVDAYEVYEKDGGQLSVVDKKTTVLGAEEHELTILVNKGQYEQAEKAEKSVAVSLNVYGYAVNGKFEVKPATITSDPEMIVIGAKNNLTLTYLDANGKPIVGKAVKVENGADLGKTDDNGQVIYPAGIVASPVTVVADTDVDVATAKVKKTINIGYDFEAPQVTYEVDGNKATLIITDNVRLVRININGEEIDFWPGARYDEYVVTLVPGVNKVSVKAQDSNDNVLNEVVEIEYKTDSIVLKDDKVQRQGDYLFVQARQFEEFGAKFAWNGETRTATFVIGDDKVEVTIGSTTAVVNGEAVTMPVAAFIADGRTYVPVRFVSENLGWNVHWAQGDIVTITLP